jgi:hypothetical protein
MLAASYDVIVADDVVDDAVDNVAPIYVLSVPCRATGRAHQAALVELPHLGAGLVGEDGAPGVVHEAPGAQPHVRRGPGACTRPLFGSNFRTFGTHRSR